MAINHVQEGNVLPYKNGATAITSGSVVAFPASIGIALVDIAANGEGSVALTGVWRLEKAAATAMAQGDRLYFSTSTKKITKTDTDVPAGIAFRAATGDATTVEVRIG
ncbi:MAG: DUF2190 family protein [Desulfobulbus sp.]|jgi:predicted RecA/RadA family phage recombinase